MYLILPRVRRRATQLIFALLVPSLAARAPEQPRRAGITIIVGRVTESSGRALANVSVAINARSLASTTDADGRYALRVVRQEELERVVVTFRRIGFGRRDLPIAVRGDTVRLDAQLAPEATRLEELVTTGAPGARADGSVAPGETRRAAPQRDQAMSSATTKSVAGSNIQ